MPVYPFAHSISTIDRGRAVALHLGQGRGAILQGHGIVTVGADLTEACALALYAEQTALRQVQAAPLGGAAPLTPDEVAEYRITLDSKALFAKCEAFHLTPERD
jgi:ribulose-5-phosphate 4-epimerase/fuculose-1-phosphate aldolase